MFNLEKRFAVVGVMEHFKTSIALMEAMLPRLVGYWSAGLARFPSLVETLHILQFPSLVHTSYILPFWSLSVQVVPRSRKSSRIRWEKHLVTKVTFIECGAAPSASTQACSYEMVTKVFFSGSNSHKNENRHPEPSLRTVEILRDRLANDIHFYQFAVQRLKIQNMTFLAAP